ncbi:hypothetical protein ACMU_10395 [Actibacterium mucosum KCTC 23349]|uniref:protein-tyrosine-phosphatase n=1 Tax=Actibacterium mucosum KCTC 23349 TaxID=1454373 RepID=A0A037ZKS0_9RHOB|nr:low molecular weight protein-tyrosine-phosphatase [Actibacterium mucosum]KAJ56152.1 hypothetical protein ACMU_10395 [Actibacterium mucosum KCTC 23349]
MTTRILFVCLGNICRSPTAHGVFVAQADAQGVPVQVESAGTGGWHIGDPPDARATAEAAARGYDLSALRAQQVQVGDFDRFDLIIAMDTSNLAALERMRPAGNTTPVELFLRYAETDRTEVPDPYYEGEFDMVLDLIEDASRGLLASLSR